MRAATPAAAGALRAAAASLGGVAGTGLTARAGRRASARAARTPATALTAGRVPRDRYGPPWGGIQGAGRDQRRAADRRRRAALVHGRRRPRLIGHGTARLRSGPTRSAGRGPFLAADTGGAIQRPPDRLLRLARPRRPDALGTTPRPDQRTPDRPGGPDTTTRSPRRVCGAPRPATSASGSGSSRAPSSAAARTSPASSRPRVGYAWCAWFATNVWRKAGVPIPVERLVRLPLHVGAARKGCCSRPSASRRDGAMPPVGVGADVRADGARAATPSTSTSSTASCPTARFMVTGGNQDPAASPATAPAGSSAPTPPTSPAPAATPRPIYGIAMPTEPRAGVTRAVSPRCSPRSPRTHRGDRVRVAPPAARDHNPRPPRRARRHDPGAARARPRGA